MDEERIKSDLDPHVDQEPHQMIGQEHVVEWCKLGFGFVQQVADQTANGRLEGLFDWIKGTCPGRRSCRHWSDGALFIQSCKCWQQRDRRSEMSLANHLLGAMFGTLQVFFRLSRRCMRDTDTWTAGQWKSESERPGNVWQQCRTRL